jgi:hypothetical protein
MGGEKCRSGAPRGVRPDRKGRETPRKRLGVSRKHAKVPHQHLRFSVLHSPLARPLIGRQREKAH